MDSFPTLIPIKHILKVSEQELKTKLESQQRISGEAKSIKEIPGLECRIDLLRKCQRDDNGQKKETLEAYLTLLNIEEEVEIGSNYAFYVKPAGFVDYHDAYFTHEANSWGGTICTFADLFDSEKKYIVDGEFVFEMKAIIFLEKGKTKTIKSENVTTERLWKDEEERDFTIVVKKDNECETNIQIHKCVLAVRSPVFKRMFKTDMKEKQEGKVEIIDFDLDTVKSAIAFCYDQEIFEDCPEWQKLVALQKFADKYDIEDLKSKTEFKFVEEICLENICEITNAVINLNAPKLQDFCFRFLFISAQERIQIKDIDKLDNRIAAEFFKINFSGDYC